MKSLESFMDSLGHDHIDILKMDIEGSEWPTLRQIAAAVPGSMIFGAIGQVSWPAICHTTNNHDPLGV